jgi:deazaflavin-dependent oxidoreductase (nitroreductase family)
MAEITQQKAWYLRSAEKAVSTRLGAWFFVTIAPHIDRPLIKLTNGRLSTVPGQPVGLVSMTGAKSGLPRQTPLVCTPDGDNWILVASNGGGTKNPDWFYNLKAYPNVTLTIQGTQGAFVARQVFDQERAVCWQKATALYAGYNAYSARSGRQIPVFLLEPAPADS